MIKVLDGRGQPIVTSGSKVLQRKDFVVPGKPDKDIDFLRIVAFEDDSCDPTWLSWVISV